jgi:hypothetical protein
MESKTTPIVLSDISEIKKDNLINTFCNRKVSILIGRVPTSDPFQRNIVNMINKREKTMSIGLPIVQEE